MSDQPVVLNGTNRFADDESHLADNIPKILQLAYFPIAGYSEYESRENQNEKKNQDKRKYEICFLQLRLSYLHLFGSPWIEVHGFNSGYMYP